MAASNADAEHGSGLRGAEEDGGRTCVLYNVPGLVPYLDGLAWQRALQRERIDHKVAHKGKVPYFLPDALVLLEHPVVYTLGSSSEFSDVLFPVLSRGGRVLVPWQVVNHRSIGRDATHFDQALR